MWWVVIGKWKNDVNGGPRWKPIKSWPHQLFEKCCKIVCDCNITLQLNEFHDIMCKHKRKIEEKKRQKCTFGLYILGLFSFWFLTWFRAYLNLKKKKKKNHVHFGPCRQPTNRKCIRAKLGKQFRAIRHQRLCLKINLHIYEGFA